MPKTFDLTNERKLTDQDVLVIRAVHIPKSPRFGSVMLAELFGVSQPTIDRVVGRETYRNLHPLLLPAWLIYAETMTDLSNRDAKFGVWARNKTEYNGERTEIRDAFTYGGYVHGLGYAGESNGLGVYAARPVRRVITPEGIQLRRMKAAQRRFYRLKQKYGDAFIEPVGLAAAGLAPRMSLEEYREYLPQKPAAPKPDNVDRDELIRRFSGAA